jgi:hypothetical protein
VKPKQDDLSRRRRLNRGACPTHGVGLMQTGVAVNKYGIPYGDVVSCPRKDCDYWTEVRPGTKLWLALRSSGG